ncbi:MAG: DUF2283 domain-containing protein [Candidatus Micrarchaeia archaeon]|jgi:uncharacterized protein YuzE
MVKFNVDYDRNNDNLFLFNAKNKSIFTLEFGNFDIDLNKKGEIVGLEFTNASKFFYILLKNNSALTSIHKVKTFLKNTKNSKIIMNNLRKGTIINIFLETETANVSTNLTIPKFADKKEIQVILN